MSSNCALSAASPERREKKINLNLNMQLDATIIINIGVLIAGTIMHQLNNVRSVRCVYE